MNYRETLATIAEDFHPNVNALCENRICQSGDVDMWEIKPAAIFRPNPEAPSCYTGLTPQQPVSATAAVTRRHGPALLGVQGTSH